MTASTPEATAVRCAYPGCENEPRVAEDGAGAKPKYCGQPDPLTGKPHTALIAFRRRQELRQDGGTAEADDLGRPVTMATARAAELRKGIRADMAALTGKLAELAAQLDRAADPESAEAQVETVQAAEAERGAAITKAGQRAGRAEAQAREAIERARAESEALVRSAEDARDQAVTQAAQADQRTATAETRAEDARAETARAREAA